MVKVVTTDLGSHASLIAKPHTSNKIKLPRGLFTNPVIIELQKHYPKLKASISGNYVTLDILELEKEELSNLETDLAFYQQNSLIAVENLCCRLDNYIPKNKTQKDALHSAIQLLEYTGSNPAGLFLQGDVGVGKTHLSIALAKEFMKRGLKTYFVTSDSIDNIRKDLREVGIDVIIIDDYNSGYAKGDSFREIVHYIHRRGGRLFITSNSTYEKVVLQESFISEEDEIPRFQDRTQGMFQFHCITGDSQRLASAWYQK